MRRNVVTEIGFDSNVSSKHAMWTNVSSDVSRIDAHRGRNAELDAIEAGTATITLDNADGRYAPARASVVAISEMFDTATAVSVNGFTSGSSRDWYIAGGATRSLTKTATGVSITTPSVASGDYVGAGMTGNNKGFAVSPGQTISFKFRGGAYVSDSPTSLQQIYLIMNFDDANSNFVSSTGIGENWNVSQGVTVEVSGTVVVPAGAAYARFGVEAHRRSPATTGPITLTMEKLELALPAPYAGKIKPRKPVRVYTILDDNLVHFECVNPVRTGEYDVPRFYTGANSTIAPSSGTWMVTPTITTNAGVWVGGPSTSDTDEISVKPGDVIKVAANCWVQSSNGVDRAGVGVAFFPRNDTGLGYSFSTYNYTTSTNPNTVVTYTYTATDVGTIRMMLWSQVATVGSTTSYRNLKMSFNSTDVDYSPTIPIGSETASGMYPVFRGYVDTWSVTSDGFTSEATVKCVDWLGIASRPIGTYYREKFTNALKTRSYVDGEAVWYWSCAQDSANTVADLTYTNTSDKYTLNILKYFDPATAGFTVGTPTMANLDGSSSAIGFTVDDSNLAKGAVLSLMDRGFPTLSKLPSENMWGTSFWFKGKVPTAGRSCLFHVTTAFGVTYAGVYMETSGKITCEVNNGVTVSTNTAQTAYVSDTPVEIRIDIKYTSATGTFSLAQYTQYPDGSVPVASSTSTTMQAGPYAPAFIQWGGRMFGSTNQDFIRGTINHVTFNCSADTTGTLNAFINSAGLGMALTANTYTGSTVVSDVFDFTGFPLNKILDTGLSVLYPPCWEDQSDGNQVLLDSAGDENGIVFMGPDGSAIFHNRYRRMSNVSRWSLSEWASDLNFVLDAAYVVNQVTAQRNTDLSKMLNDPDSIAEFGVQERTVRRNVANPDELTQAAGWILHRYRGTNPRCDTLELDVSAANGPSDAGLLALAHGGTLSDRLTMSGLPVTAPADTLTFYIEGVDVRIEAVGSKLHYSVTFNVSDANRSVAFILEDPVYGILDADASVLIY